VDCTKNDTLCLVLFLFCFMESQNRWFIALIVLLFLFVGGVFTGQISLSPDVGVASEEKVIPADVDDFANAFLYHIKMGRLDRAYGRTTEVFQSFTPFENFKTMLEFGGFADANGVHWTSLEKQDSGRLQVGASLVFDDNAREIAFDLLKVADGWMIDILTLGLDSEKVHATFPSDGDLKNLVGSHINAFRESLEDLEGRQNFYSRMSRKGREGVSFDDFDHVLDQFREQGLDVSFFDVTSLSFDVETPVLDGGQALVEGSYVNGINRVDFSFLYDYEWEWRVNSFSINAEPIENEDDNDV
jgi:hypothetical protein